MFTKLQANLNGKFSSNLIFTELKMDGRPGSFQGSSFVIRAHPRKSAARTTAGATNVPVGGGHGSFSVLPYFWGVHLLGTSCFHRLNMGWGNL